jgi:hypothetical protein
MPTGTDTLTLELILTGAGVTVAATLIASTIEILKRLPGLGSALGSNAGAASTLLAGVLVVYAYLATATAVEAAGAFAAFLAWVGIAGLAGKAYDVGRTVKGSLTSG